MPTNPLLAAARRHSMPYRGSVVLDDYGRPILPAGVAQQLDPGLQAAIGLIGQLISGGASAINTAITSGNATEIARIRSETETNITRLMNQQRTAEQDRQLAALQMLQNATRPQGVSPTTMALIGVGALILVGGGVYLLTRGGSRRRSNPVIGRLPERRFVPAYKLAGGRRANPSRRRRARR